MSINVARCFYCRNNATKYLVRLKDNRNQDINKKILWCGCDRAFIDFGKFKEGVHYRVETMVYGDRLRILSGIVGGLRRLYEEEKIKENCLVSSLINTSISNINAAIAQLAEPSAHNALVAGSSPAGRTEKVERENQALDALIAALMSDVPVEEIGDKPEEGG